MSLSDDPFAQRIRDSIIRRKQDAVFLNQLMNDVFSDDADSSDTVDDPPPSEIDSNQYHDAVNRRLSW